jgi:chlorobactene glucosyltransferase
VDWHLPILVGHLVLVLVLLFSAVVLWVNLRLLPRLRCEAEGSPDEDAPLVSVLVPARNEAANIEKCVASLLAQDYPRFQVRVLDDHSEDDTAARVRALGLTEENGGLVAGQDLPEGWVGKNWACHQLSRLAEGEYLLFTDADTVHAPEVLSALVRTAREHRADLVSAWPRQIVGHWSEKLVVSLLPFAGALYYPHGLLWWLGRYPGWRRMVPRGLRRHLGAANGQVLFFSRTGYDAVGGHEALRGHLVEDVALGRAMAERMGEGLWWVNVDSGGMVSCRMYRSLGQVWEGFTKNARAVFEESLWGFVFAGLGQVVLMILPFVWVFLPLPCRGLAGLEVGLILGLRAAVTVRLGGSWWSVWLHPLAWLMAVAIGLNSWRRTGGRGVVWKGRLYSVKSPKT